MKKLLVSVAALTMSVGAASATTVFSDNFDDPANTQNWQVYQNFSDWYTSSGVGIEVQTSGVVPGVSAQSGEQYVELDSDCQRQGATPNPSCPRTSFTNSSMTTELFLSKGSYELTWYYLPRTSTPDDNEITVSVDRVGTSIGNNPIGTENGTRPPINDWALITYNFVITEADTYGLTFAAGGTDNELGGFVDTVNMSIVPLPAAGWMLLAGLGGMAALRRRQKA